MSSISKALQWYYDLVGPLALPTDGRMMELVATTEDLMQTSRDLEQARRVRDQLKTELESLLDSEQMTAIRSASMRGLDIEHVQQFHTTKTPPSHELEELRNRLATATRLVEQLERSLASAEPQWPVPALRHVSPARGFCVRKSKVAAEPVRASASPTSSPPMRRPAHPNRRADRRWKAEEPWLQRVWPRFRVFLITVVVLALAYLISIA